ncbi:MAG: LysR family transcriptional regulator [Deltaproteobacteria bacterium]|nr:LysR family transcriptional regulator [Deltaproteobacteria bacterium]
MDEGRIDLNRVAIFVQIAQTGGVSAAAAKMKLPKSSVSRGLSLLESELGVELVARSSRSLRLTDAGRAFFDAASKGIAAVDEAREALRSDKGAPRGTVRVAAPPGFATFLVAPVIARFVREHRGVEVDLVVTGQRLDPVRDGFDVVLALGKLDDSSSKTRALGSVDTGAFASPDYLRARGTPKRPVDLAKHDCILQRANGKRERWSFHPANTGKTSNGARGTNGAHADPSQAGRVKTHPETVVSVTGPLRVDDLTTAAASAVAGAGIALLPLHMAAKHPAAAGLVRVLPEWLAEGDPAQLVFPASPHLPLAVRMLCDAFLAAAGSTCPTSPAR